MRWVLALCVVAGCTLSGCAMAGAARRRVRLLEALIEGVRRMRPHMIGMFEPVKRALEASGCPILEAVGGGMDPGVTASAAWARARKAEGRRGGGIDALSAEDLEILDGLFEQLGETGRDQQELLLNGVCAALQRNLEDARRRVGEADRLYISLGALTGLMIALILI